MIASIIHSLGITHTFLSTLTSFTEQGDEQTTETLVMKWFCIIMTQQLDNLIYSLTQLVPFGFILYYTILIQIYSSKWLPEHLNSQLSPYLSQLMNILSTIQQLVLHNLILFIMFIMSTLSQNIEELDPKEIEDIFQRLRNEIDNTQQPIQIFQDIRDKMMNSSMLSHSNIKYGSDDTNNDHKNILDCDSMNVSETKSVESESTMCQQELKMNAYSYLSINGKVTMTNSDLIFQSRSKELKVLSEQGKPYLIKQIDTIRVINKVTNVIQINFRESKTNKKYQFQNITHLRIKLKKKSDIQEWLHKVNEIL